jgi:hypothetical protein
MAVSVYLLPLLTYSPGSQSLGPENVVLYCTTFLLVISSVPFLLKGFREDGIVIRKSKPAKFSFRSQSWVR